MPSKHLLIALTLLSSPVVAAPAYQLRTEKTGWDEASQADLSKVLRSSCDAIAQHLGDVVLKEPLRVRHDPGGPITLFRRNVRGEIVIELSSKGLFWSQHAYQMAHEFCHVLCGFRKGGRENLWFEESLCELASLFAMRSMAESWKTSPPYPNWKNYSNSLDKYITDVAKKHALPGGTDLPAFVKLHLTHLRETPTDRAKNGIVALALLPLFEESPESWQSLRFLNAGRGKEGLPFPQHLKNWHEQSPREHQGFVKKVAGALGYRL